MTKNAESSTVKLTYLIADLLSTTRIDQGQLALNLTKFPVGELIDSCCSHIHLEGGYQLKREGDDSIMLYADQQKTEQVMVNLVNNAVKYASESMVITIRFEQLPTAVKITVIDQGPGIAQDHLNQLFDRYFRVDEKKHQTSGLGLGLYISAEIIKRHGGEIGVDSKLNEGSEFWFTLPNAG